MSVCGKKAPEVIPVHTHISTIPSGSISWMCPNMQRLPNRPPKNTLPPISAFPNGLLLTLRSTMGRIIAAEVFSAAEQQVSYVELIRR